MTESIQIFNLITNYGHIASRTNFIEKVSIERGQNIESLLEDLIGYYLFRDKVKCGISSCGTKHQKGYLAVLNSGQEIIIGHNCGKKYFGISFDDKAGQFSHLKDNATQYLRVKETFEQLSLILSRYEEVLSSSAKMNFVNLGNTIKAFNNRVLSYWIRDNFKKNISTNGIISEQVYKTKDEIALERIMKESNGRTNQFISEYKIVELARVNEWDIFANWHKAEKLKDWLDSVHREIKNPNSMQPENIKKLYRKLKDYSSNFQDLESYCVRANKLFEYNNLIKLTLACQKDQDRKIIEAYAKNFL